MSSNAFSMSPNVCRYCSLSTDGLTYTEVWLSLHCEWDVRLVSTLCLKMSENHEPGIREQYDMFIHYSPKRVIFWTCKFCFWFFLWIVLSMNWTLFHYLIWYLIFHALSIRRSPWHVAFLSWPYRHSCLMRLLSHWPCQGCRQIFYIFLKRSPLTCCIFIVVIQSFISDKTALTLTLAAV